MHRITNFHEKKPFFYSIFILFVWKEWVSSTSKKTDNSSKGNQLHFFAQVQNINVVSQAYFGGNFTEKKNTAG